MSDAGADQEVSTSPAPSAPKSRQGGPRSPLIGWLFITPAVVLLVWQQVVPAVRTVIGSLQHEPGGAWVGLTHYQAAVDRGLPADLASGIGFGLLPAVLGFVAGFGAGRLFAGAQGGLRGAGLVLLALALLWIAPSSLMLSTTIWFGIGFSALLVGLLTWLPASLMVGALVGAMLPPGARVRRALTFGVLIAAVAGAALGTQSLALAPTGNIPGPPAGRQYIVAFTTIDMGPALAVGSALLVVAIMSGVVVTRALLASGLRLRIAPREASLAGGDHAPVTAGAADASAGGAPDQAPPGQGDTDDGPARAGVMAVVVGAAILLVAVLASLPWLVEALRSGPAAEASWLPVWLGDGLEVLAAVVVAALAGIGIGYLRPLGDRSLPVLLTALSPLLLIGLGPLLPSHFLQGLEQGVERLASEPGVLAWLYPHSVVVPLVFLAAYLADASHVAKQERVSAAPGGVMAAALGLAGVALLILRSESSAVRLLPLPSPERTDVVGAIQRLDIAGMVAHLKPWPVLLLLAGVVGLCAAGIRRLRIHTPGAQPRPERKATAGN